MGKQGLGGWESLEKHRGVEDDKRAEEQRHKLQEVCNHQHLSSVVMLQKRVEGQ